MTFLLFTVTAATAPDAVHSVAQRDATMSPEILRVPHRSGKPAGLLYTPELLARLAAGKPAGSVPARIARAIEEHTPVVVMWTLDPSLMRGDDPHRPPSYPRPYKMAIVPAGQTPLGQHRIDPVWIEQDASVIRELDTQTAFDGVGAVAAFPADAFVRGRLVFLYSDYWSAETLKSHSIWAAIEGNGGAH
jgi:hypothetical protein